MKIKNIAVTLNSILLIPLVLIGTTSSAAPVVPQPVINETRIYFGPCPSQNKDRIDSQKSGAVLGVGALVGGELIKLGFDSLATALDKASQSKPKYTYASANLTDTKTIGMSDCITIIEGGFALVPNDNKAIDDFHIYAGLEKNLSNIKTNLTDNGIFLASVPTKYIELRIFHPEESMSNNASSLAKGFYVSPLLFVFNKPLGRNSYGFHTGEREIVVSAALNSSTTTVKNLDVLRFSDVDAPTVYYFSPALSKGCSQKYSVAQTKAGLMPLCGGERGSAWIQYPQGNGPYRFEISVAETRDASKFVKALSDALNKPEIKSAVVAGAQSKLISEYRENADSRERQADLLLVEKAGEKHLEALNAYKTCTEVGPGKKIEGVKALADFNLKRLKSENANEGIKEDVIKLFGGELPVITECPPKEGL